MAGPNLSNWTKRMLCKRNLTKTPFFWVLKNTFPGWYYRNYIFFLSFSLFRLKSTKAIMKLCKNFLSFSKSDVGNKVHNGYRIICPNDDKFPFQSSTKIPFIIGYYIQTQRGLKKRKCLPKFVLWITKQIQHM